MGDLRFYILFNSINPIALKTAETPLSFGWSEYNRVKIIPVKNNHIKYLNLQSKINLYFITLSIVCNIMALGFAKQSGSGPSSLHILPSTSNLTESGKPRGLAACKEKYL